MKNTTRALSKTHNNSNWISKQKCWEERCSDLPPSAASCRRLLPILPLQTRSHPSDNAPLLHPPKFHTVIPSNSWRILLRRPLPPPSPSIAPICTIRLVILPLPFLIYCNFSAIAMLHCYLSLCVKSIYQRFFLRAEHSHELSADSELVKHFKNVIKVSHDFIFFPL